MLCKFKRLLRNPITAFTIWLRNSANEGSGVCRGGGCVLPWTRRCTEVVLGRLLVCTAHTYWPSSVMSTFWILMVNSSWFRVTRLTLGSTDHLSSPAYSMLDRLSHAVCVTTSPCAHLWRDTETNTHFRSSRRIGALDKYFRRVFGRECTVSDWAENFKETRLLSSLQNFGTIYYSLHICKWFSLVWPSWTIIVLIMKPSEKRN